MQQMTTSKATATSTDTLFQHVRKPEWGLAIMAWERDGKRGYQFEDGKLRIFAQGYYEFLQHVVRPLDETERAADALNAALGRRRATKRIGAQRPIPLAMQLALFLRLYPKGFTGVKWAKEKRGVDAKRTLKRHRAAVIVRAGELVTAVRLAGKVAAGDSLSIVGDLVELMNATDLVTKAQLRGFDRITEPKAGNLVSALAEVLWGEGDLAPRFDRWVRALNSALSKKVKWELATAVLALVAPGRLVCVKHSTFVRQAAWLAPGLVIDKIPTGRVYARILEMMDALQERLGDAGAVPRDRIDLHDFIKATLCPKAVKELTAMIDAEAAPNATQSADDLAA